MPSFYPSAFLRNTLLADAAASGATGLLVILGAGFLESWLGLPAAFLRTVGLILVPYVAFVLFVGARETVTAGAIWTIVLANAVWALASFGLLVSGMVAPTLLGYAFVIAQAVVVALFGELQYIALRRQAAVAT